MSAKDFVLDELQEVFATTSRLSAEVMRLREQLVRAEMKIDVLESALADQEDQVVSTVDSGEMKSSDTAIIKKMNDCEIVGGQ